jgi:hypothetical protein
MSRRTRSSDRDFENDGKMSPKTNNTTDLPIKTRSLSQESIRSMGSNQPSFSFYSHVPEKNEVRSQQAILNSLKFIKNENS